MTVLHARLSRPAARHVKKHHPWVFDKSITHLSSNDASPGDLTVLHDDKRQQIGIGLYDPNSPIRVRVLHSGGPAKIDADFFKARVQKACAKREILLQENTNGYRVLHGENDGFGGLVADRYAETLVVKIYSEAWVPYLDWVIDALKEILEPERVILRLARKIKEEFSLDDATKQAEKLSDGQLYWGVPLTGDVEFLERGIHFLADPIRGQKTGFFLDQRENRARVEVISAGARVLNVFSYSGGFSLFAARGGAKEVVSLDFSRPALEAAETHFLLNSDNENIKKCQHRILQGDAFAEMRKLIEQKKYFDVIIVDPPSFAKRESEIEGALHSYSRLMKLALQLLTEGGQLVFASCSSRISSEMFRENAETVALQNGRPLHILEQSGHALDHPATFTEATYLKCLFSRA